MSKFTLDLVNQIGMSIGVNADTIEDLYDEMRRFGSMGWTSGAIPSGGYRLPYEMADTFDFTLIGAREFTVADKESGEILKCVEHRGHVYKRRDLPPTNKIKKAVIKYSRGARPVDDDSAKEGADDGVQYVTLIQFEGKGRPIAALEKKSSRPAPAQQPTTQQPAAVQHTPPRQSAAAMPSAEPAKATGAKAGVGSGDTADEAELARLLGEEQTSDTGAPTTIDILFSNLSDADTRRIKAIATSKGLWKEPYARLRLLASTITDEPGEPLFPEQGQQFFETIKAESVAS